VTSSSSSLYDDGDTLVATAIGISRGARGVDVKACYRVLSARAFSLKFFFQRLSHIRGKIISSSHCKNKSTSF
jgi:hypothetical protein